MSRQPDYEALYKLALILMKENSVDLDTFDASSFAKRVGCHKHNIYNHIERMKVDICSI